MITLTGSQARALFDLADAAALVKLRVGGTTRRGYAVVVDVLDADLAPIRSGVLDTSGGWFCHHERVESLPEAVR